MLTAKGARQDRLDGLREYAEAYLVKPFDAEELLVLVETRIAVRTRLRERFRREASASAAQEADGPEATFLDVVQAAIHAHLGDDRLTVERLAEAVGVSRVHLYRQLRDATGQTPSDAIWTARLARAADLLARRAGTVSEVAYAVGFKNVGHFSDRFEAFAGCRPSDYRGEPSAPR